MSRLGFAVLGAAPEPYAAAPQLTLRILVQESSGIDIYAIALRVQIMIEPQRRRYSAAEGERLVELFGTQDRYGETLRPLLWTHAGQLVSAFRGATEIALPVACSYDFDVAAHKYLAGLDDGEIPLNLLFSGTVIERGEHRLASGFVPWSCEARFALPHSVWRATMDAHFPNTAWMRVSRETFEEVRRYQSAQGCPTFDAALTRLLDAVAAQR